MNATSPSEKSSMSPRSQIPSYTVSKGRKLLSVSERSHLIIEPPFENRVAGDECHTRRARLQARIRQT